MAGAQEADTPGVILFPPLILLLALAAALALDFSLPLAFLPEPSVTGWLFWLGLVLGFTGIAFAVAGQRSFRRAGTNVSPHKPALKMVETGPYRFTRNPMYLGIVLFFAGMVLAGSLEWGLLILPVLIITLQIGVIAREERYLSRKFGAPYDAFKARTRRWL